MEADSSNRSCMINSIIHINESLGLLKNRWQDSELSESDKMFDTYFVEK
jgi:hypothetical protein